MNVHFQNTSDIEDALNHLSQERADDYTKWLEVGIILKSMFPDELDRRGLELWIKFSRRSPKSQDMSDNDFESKWSMLKTTGRSAKSLLYNLYIDDKPYLEKLLGKVELEK